MVDGLCSYAATEAASRGRTCPEPPHPYRSDFERDRDRIIHSSAFRRLEGKTQVFSPGLDDYYRSRLTHSIEVSQIGRTLARTLGLNEGLTEAICLAHDLGHPPFGHTGEMTLHSLMAAHGGFEHNTQTLRIVMLLEHPYPAFMGLNLMHETLLGLFRKAKNRGSQLPASSADFDEPNCTLEGQIADVADRIAYNCHDLEDGLRARLIDGNQMRDIQIYTDATRKVGVERIPDWTIRRTRTAKTITDRLVSDCIETSRRNIAEAGVRTVREVCDHAGDLIGLSSEGDRELTQLERFLLANLYHHERLLEAAKNARRWLTELFGQLCRDPHRMPSYFRDFIPQYGLERAVCDYIAGMTDRYCLKVLERDSR
ncbi:MAG: dGTP triphosphohydrolase [Solirubrobacterales bacterium]